MAGTSNTDSRGRTKRAASPSQADLSHQAAIQFVSLLQQLERFTEEDMALCTGALLDKLRAVPIRDTIYLDPYSRNLFVHGEPASADVRHRLVTSCHALRRNAAWNLIKTKVELASLITARNAATTGDLIFGKAAVWFIQEMDKVIELIAGSEGDSPAEDGE